MPRYTFKPAAELGWAVALAVALVLLPALVTLDPAEIADWRTWAVALGGAAIRAAAGAALDYVRRGLTQPADPVPSLVEQVVALSPSDRLRLIEGAEHATLDERIGRAGLITRQPEWLEGGR